MKNIILISLAVLVAAPLAIGQNFRGLDKSPLDIAYFPDNFAHDRRPGDQVIVKVTYSRPQKNGRELFGSLVPFGKVWRTGANENTEIKFYKKVKIGGKSIEPGTYSLFSVPGEDEWTIILNKDLDYWGAYRYNQEQDITRVKVPSKELDKNVEAFSIQFEKIEDNKVKMQMAWGHTLVEMPFEY